MGGGDRGLHVALDIYVINICMTYYYIYQITNLINGKIYVGVHKTKTLDDGYMGSGKIIQRAITRYGVENFKKDILEFFDTPEDMYSREKEFVTEEFLARDDVYNLRRGGTGGFDYLNKINPTPFKGRTHTDDTKQHLSEINTGRKHSVETKEKISINNWSKSNPEKQREHARTIASNRIRTEEEKIRISTSLKGRQSPKRDIVCPHCQKHGGENVMKRWHFDNCKLRGQ